MRIAPLRLRSCHKIQYGDSGFARMTKVWSEWRRKEKENAERCVFSATANFVGSGVLAALGAVTLTRVKHRRELMFAALPTMFAIHQFTEGFVWLGMDGYRSRRRRCMGGRRLSCCMRRGLLPALMPLSVFLYEPNGKARWRMMPFLGCGGFDDAVYVVGADGVSVYGGGSGQQPGVRGSGDAVHVGWQ